jgi:hypothetical protein
VPSQLPVSVATVVTRVQARNRCFVVFHMINGGFRGCCSASSVFKTVYFATWLAVAIYSAQRPSDSRSHDEFVPGIADALSVDELWALREDARDMFYHGYDAYMSFGYPWDELKPLSCMGRRWDVRERGTLDDSLGGGRPVACSLQTPLENVCAPWFACVRVRAHARGLVGHAGTYR